MKVLIDACVLYPTVMREMVIGAADEKLFTPLWSPRILEEWTRATKKLGPEQELYAQGEVALLKAKWPNANVKVRAKDLSRLWLPDENDIHVLAAAIAGGADVLLTMNNSDFPRHTLHEEGLKRDSPDLFLCAFVQSAPDQMLKLANRIVTQAQTLSQKDWTIRTLMKKARLPRLGKALEHLT